MAPAASVGQIQEYLNTSNAYYEITDPTPDDDVPILLANNKFARLFEPIMRLYMLPKYRELDLTPYLPRSLCCSSDFVSAMADTVCWS